MSGIPGPYHNNGNDELDREPENEDEEEEIINENNPHNESSCYLLAIFILLAILVVLCLSLKSCKDELQSAKEECKTDIENLRHHFDDEITGFEMEINDLSREKDLLEIEKNASEKNIIRDYTTCKEEKAICLNQRDELRIKCLSEEVLFKHVKCDSKPWGTCTECEKEKENCLNETAKLTASFHQLEVDKAGIYAKYELCEDLKEEYKREKTELQHRNTSMTRENAVLDVKYRILEEKYKGEKQRLEEMEPELNGLKLQVITLNLSHSSKIESCERKFDTAEENMLENKKQYEACLREKDSIELQWKVKLLKCQNNLNQTIKTNSDCQKSLDKCWF